MKKLLLIAFVLLTAMVQAQNFQLVNYCNNSVFDLTQANAQLLGNQNPAEVVITYHLSQADATNNSNPITVTNSFTATSSQQMIFARLQNTVTSIVTIFPFSLVVMSTLEVTIVDLLMSPTASVAAMVSGGQAPYTYAWSINGGALTTTPTSEFVLPPVAGTFTISVTVTDSTGCTGTGLITVTSTQSIIANDDSFTLTNLGGIEPPGFYPVLANDFLNGLPATLNNVSLSLIYSTNPNIWMDIEGGVHANQSTLSGTYTLFYQICERSNPSNCDTATATILVDFCRADTPVIGTIVQPLCDGSQGGSVTLTGLPDVGQWTLAVTRGTSTTNYNGTGVSYTLNDLAAGTYQVTVLAEDILLGNCYASLPVSFTIDQTNGVSLQMTGDYNDTNANGITDLGDTVHYQFAVRNHACITATEVSVVSTELTVAGSPISLDADQSDNTTFTATHILTQQDINSGVVRKSASALAHYGIDSVIAGDTLAVSLHIPDGIKFNAFLDHNHNNIQDNNEPNFPHVNFYYLINGGPTMNFYTGTGSYTLYETTSANNYIIGCQLLTPNTGCQFNYTLSTSAYNNVTVTAGSGVVLYNFPITISSTCNDLEVFLYNYNAPPRPGFVYQNFIHYRNASSQTIASGTVSFSKDNLLTITNISQTGTVPTANGFTYDFTNLAPNESRYITISMQVPTIPTIALGDILNNSAKISLLPDEINELNNIDTLRQMVVGSYDPNDKSESHGGKIVHSSFTANDYLTYTIRFENTGNAEAISIKVDDVLDAKLDETSVRMVKASHPYVLERVGSNLSWRFDGVGLPPSVEGDEITGHGYIIFQVKPKPGFALGDIIPNSANIYFDFNPAIVTNTTTTEFVPMLGIDAFEDEAFRYFPNPTTSTVTFSTQNAAIDKIEITDLLGKTLISKTVQSPQAVIDLSALNSGIYFAKLSSGTKERTVKLIRK